MVQSPFESYSYRGFASSSPPSSPCSFTVDSSPPSSPGAYAPDLNGELHEGEDVEGSESEGDEKGAIVRVLGGERDVKGKGKQPAVTAYVDASPAHPFSASTRAVKRPPRYDKGTARVKVKRQRQYYDLDEYERDLGERGARLRNDFGLRFDPFAAAQRGGIYERDAYLHDSYPRMNLNTNDDFGSGGVEEVVRSHDPEHTLWEETIAQAVDGAECKIDLSGQGLTYIPPRIADLSNLVVFRDNVTSSRGDLPRRTPSKSTNSLVFGAGKLGMREDEVHLFLGNNRISMLPNELFNLDALVMLSLRGNLLTELPPQICRLRNLRELNVANNRLRYLPSEIMNLKLTSLAVDPNPFVENPYAAKEPLKNRWFGPMERNYTITPFSELTLRVLLAPVFGGNNLTATTKTMLETVYELPLPTDYEISPALRETLSSCVPGSIASLLSPNVTPHSSLGVLRERSQCVGPRACVSECPSSRHLVIGNNNHYRRPVFVTHAEERLSWEKEVAGQKVGGENGIPVRWRGCSAGCLDELEMPSDAGIGDADGDWDTMGIEIDCRRKDVFVLCDDSIPGASPVSSSERVEQFHSEGFEFDD
ncbi:hypothetical protein M0805_001078 [Coniferiporia weirii]|nr:hypothetical protein M0805_001078 [Coniferiporia weirii]